MGKTLVEVLLEAPMETHPSAFESGKVFVIMDAADGRYITRGTGTAQLPERATLYPDLHGAITGARIAQNRDANLGELLICPVQLHVDSPVKSIQRK